MSKLLLPKGLRKFFYKWYLKKQKAPNHHSVGFNKANSFGILVNMEQDFSVKLAQEYCSALQKTDKKVEILAYKKKYSDEEASIENGSNTAMALFTSRDLNWYERPDHPSVTHFIKKEFDVLINSDLSHNMALEFVAATSYAKFRIGKYDEYQSSNYELMIQMPPNNDHKYFYDQVDHYLKMIKE